METKQTKTEEKTIYNLGLGESLTLEVFTKVLRVPGGWIFTEFTEHDDYRLSSVFVPYNNEFQIVHECDF